MTDAQLLGEIEARVKAARQEEEPEVPDFEPVPEDEQPRLDQKSPIRCPHCGEEFIPK